MPLSNEYAGWIFVQYFCAIAIFTTLKKILEEYASYNVWANQRMTNAIRLLPVEFQQKELPGSFKSLQATLEHLWFAESIWWQRLKLVEHVLPPGFTGLSMPEVIDGLIKQSIQWDNWVAEAKEAALVHVFHYQNTKREMFKQPVYQMLLHLFNHQTYHRGQLVSMLHQLGVSAIPASDFIDFSRKKK